MNDCSSSQAGSIGHGSIYDVSNVSGQPSSFTGADYEKSELWTAAYPKHSPHRTLVNILQTS